MKILMINVVCGIRSTGRICTDLAEELERQGHEVKIAYGRFDVPESGKRFAIKIGTDSDIKYHAALARGFDAMGLGSRRATKQFLQWVQEFDPDIIHLHNLHGYYLNIPLLFQYLRFCGKKILWTMHDCWAFTGHCAFFDFCECGKWKTGCERCSEKKAYPTRLFIDRSKQNFQMKQRLFSEIPNLTIITPSAWLRDLLKQSFLREYPVVVITNGIDVSVFRPTERRKRQELKLDNKVLVLGVAAVWDRRKGLEDFIHLSRLLDDNYQILLIGLDKNQINMLPSNIMGIQKTDSAAELADYYSSADYFINPTYEDNFPTTNLEAISCGTPVITYCTGGSSESASFFGAVVPKGDVAGIAHILRDRKQMSLFPHDFSRQAMVNSYLCVILSDV